MIAKRPTASHQHSARNGTESASRARRRQLGIYYTPAELVEPILDATLDPILAEMEDEASCRSRLARLRIIDPACGSGHFLIASWRRLMHRITERVEAAKRYRCLQQAATTLHGIDIDPEARRIGRALLQAECERVGLSVNAFCNWFTLGDGLAADPTLDHTFDLVLGNPPFVDSESMCATDRARRRELSQRFETARGNWDLASLFVERATQLARPGGRVGMVLPRRLLAADHAQHVQTLLRRQTIESIRPGDVDAFEGAAVETVNLVVTVAPPPDGHAIDIRSADRNRRVAQAELELLPPGHWSALLRADDEAGTEAADWRCVLARFPRLAAVAFAGDGATTGEAYRLREAVREEAACTAPSLRLINTGTIDPFVSRWGCRPTRYLRAAWNRPVVPLAWLDEHLPRRAVQGRSPKVLVAGLAGRIEAVVDDGGALCGKSAVQIIPEDPDQCHALCAWLNSTPINDLYRHLFESRGFGSRSMHIGPRQLEQLPVWECDHGGHGDAIDELGELSRTLHAGEAPEARLERIDLLVRSILDAAMR